MKILYNQSHAADSLLAGFGIQNCYLKYLLTEWDGKSISRKLHHHTDYEIHIVEAGTLRYETPEGEYPLAQGDLLLVPPGVSHRVVSRSAGAATFSVTFRQDAAGRLSALGGCVCARIPQRVRDTLGWMLAEATRPQMLSEQLVSAGLWEILVQVWRLCGAGSQPVPAVPTGEDPRLTLAKQYIADNIGCAPTVADVASYCHMSAKQLGRLFLEQEGSSPGAYIQKQRAEQAQRLLRESPLTLRQISEQMHFSSEYYFHAFFKKHAGMPPGEFRRMYKKGR